MDGHHNRMMSKKAATVVTKNVRTSARYLLESASEIMGGLSSDSAYPRYLPKAFDVHVLRRTYGLSVCSPLGC